MRATGTPSNRAEQLSSLPLRLQTGIILQMSTLGKEEILKNIYFEWFYVKMLFEPSLALGVNIKINMCVGYYVYTICAKEG